VTVPTPLFLAPTFVTPSARHITMTLDRYSHWMPSMGRNTADEMDEALG
jgi:hypothetical protein